MRICSRGRWWRSWSREAGATDTTRRFGSRVVDLAPPAAAPATRLGLQPRVLFRV
jgi:hypothetical protein